MTTDRDFDRIAQAWLAGGPDELPDRVIDAAVDQIHLTRQRRAVRMPWRLPGMITPTRVAGAAVIGVLVLGGTLLLIGRLGGQPAVGGAPSPTAPASAGASQSTGVASPSAPSMPALTETFTSPRYGYSVRYLAGWTTQPATKPWTTGIDTLYRDPALDAIGGDEALLAVASAPLKAGQSPEEWLAPYCRSGSSGAACGRAISIGDATGYVAEDGSSAEGGTVATGGVIFDAAVVSGGRGYVFILDGHVSRALFEAILKTVTLDPAAAHE